MSHYLKNRRILVGVTGSIAAYKSLELVSQLKQQGAEVRVVMTRHAREFVTPLSFATLCGHPVLDYLFSDPLAHIELAKWAELIVIAPATAHSIAKWTVGLADDLLSALLLATEAAVVIAPAMNQQMWAHSVVQHNLDCLKKRGIHVIGPASGLQACGDQGLGRMSEVQDILQFLPRFFQPQTLRGKTILINAGPTQEALDPVRYLSNYSSGKMGYALARSAYYQGARVILISGPSALIPPPFCEVIQVKSAAEMQGAVHTKINEVDVFIACAAICDFKPSQVSAQKIKKHQAHLNLKLIQNSDIISSVSHLQKKPFVLGFAAETENVLENAQKKLRDKYLDAIIANQVGENLGFNQEEQAVFILNHAGVTHLSRAPKAILADQIIAWVSAVLEASVIPRRQALALGSP